MHSALVIVTKEVKIYHLVFQLSTASTQLMMPY